MGQKVHPTGFRIGVIRDWDAKWYADKRYADFLNEDITIRSIIQKNYRDAGISRIEIDRQSNQITVTVHTARPGVVIGRGGQRVDEARNLLEKVTGKKIRLNIQEIEQAEQDAILVAKSIAEQIERRVSYKRAMKQASLRTMQSGAKGIKITCAGRLAGAEIARRETIRQGRVPLHTLRANIDYGITEAHTTLGCIGIKVWIYKGDILPQPKEVEEEVIHRPIAADTEPTKLPAEEDTKPAVPASLELGPESSEANVETNNENSLSNESQVTEDATTEES